jgi:hypothetical protein
MAVDLDLEVSDEDRKFVEPLAPDNIDKMLDDFIGDKKSPVKNALKPSLKKPEDTVKKPTGTAGKKLSFVGDPPKKCARRDGSRVEKGIQVQQSGQQKRRSGNETSGQDSVQCSESGLPEDADKHRAVPEENNQEEPEVSLPHQS